MEQLGIQQTNNYKKFSLHHKNRVLSIGKVEKLAEAMKRNNLLHLYPIIVNKKNEILDGQHRFEAAKIAKCEIFYLVSDATYDIGNVAESNSFQKGWNLADYIRFWAKSEKPEYLRVVALAKKYDIRATAICNLSEDSGVSEKIRKGIFVLKNEKSVVEFMQHAKAIGIEYGFTNWHDRPFLRAIKFILNINGYNKLRMGQKIRAHRSLLVRKHDHIEYIKLLEIIYNQDAVEELRFL